MPGTPAVALGPVGAYLGVGGARGNATGYVGALYSLSPGSGARWQVRATAQYAFSPSLAVYAAYHATPGVTQPGFSASSSSGVAAVYRHQAPSMASPISVQLENPAAISVLVNGQLLGSVDAPAGEITLLNVPLPRQSHNTVELLIEDENGITSRRIEDVSPSADSLKGGLFASLSAAYDDQAGAAGWSAAATVAYAVTPELSVDAQAGLTGTGTVRAAAQMRYGGSPLSGSLGAQVSRPANTPGAAAPALSTRISGSLAYRQGPLAISVAAAVPINAVSGSTLNLTTTYSAAPWSFTAGVSTGLTSGSWQVDGGLSRAFNQRSVLGLAASVRPGGWRIGLRGTYVFTPELQGTAGVTQGPDGTSPSASLTYRPDPTQAISLNADLEEIGVTYGISRGLEASVAATTRSATAQVTGAVSSLDGHLRLSAGLAQRGLLIRTGVPSLKLIVDGLGTVVTNPRGDALIPQATPAQTVSVRVDVHDLPLGVSVRSVEAQVSPAATGLTVIDWRDNFEVSTFVQFRWTTAEVASNADLYLDGVKVPLDDEGYGLVPLSDVNRTGELRGPDGARRCAVVLAPGAKEAACAADPGSR